MGRDVYKKDSHTLVILFCFSNALASGSFLDCGLQ